MPGYKPVSTVDLLMNAPFGNSATSGATRRTGGIMPRHASGSELTRPFRESELSTSPLDHRQRCERVLQKSINRQLNEPSMEAGVRPRGVDSRDERAREAEPS